MNQYQKIVSLVMSIERLKLELKQKQERLKGMVDEPRRSTPKGNAKPRLESNVSLVLEAFKPGKTLSSRAIIKKSGVKRNSVGPVLVKLVKENKITREKRGHYRLTQ